MAQGVRPVKSGWYNAFRPWTLHGAVVPVLIGGAVAYKDGGFCWWIFILTLIGGCLLQSAANLLNTYGDYRNGLDTKENHSRSPELVSGTLKPKSVRDAGLACLAVTALIGIVFIWYCGWGILAIGLAGILAAATYTLGVAYKYSGFGQLSVFVMMGLLMPIGTYYVLMQTVTWELVLMSLPNACMITAVLGGNELRDFESDKAGGLRTLSIKLGYGRGMLLYRSLCTVPFIILFIEVFCSVLQPTCLLALLALWQWYKVYTNSTKAKDDRKCGFMMVPMAFKLNWVFGALLVIGYLLGMYVVL
jgi:1,4-dihydroxy-2-naphthoate octaprenyltransferase